MEGYIKLSRKVLAWHWYTNPNTFRLFIHLLLKATHTSVRWQNIELLPGQLMTGRKVLAVELKLSEREIRTALKNLLSTSEIAIIPTSKFSIITICNWDVYQQSGKSQRPSKRPTERPTSDQQATTYNKDKKDKKAISIIFDVFRIAYPGTKQGLDTELKNFFQKYDPEIVHLLLPALEKEKQYHADLQRAGEFEPNWKNLKTWINGQCWEQELPLIKSGNAGAHKPIIEVKIKKEWQ